MTDEQVNIRDCNFLNDKGLKMRCLAFRINLGVAVCLLAAVGQSQAGSIAYNFTTIKSAQTDFSMSTDVHKFDSSLGMLESVEIIYTSDITSAMTVTNTSAKGKTTGSFDTEVQLTLDDSKNRISQSNEVFTPTTTFSVDNGDTKTYPASGVDKGTGTSDQTYTEAKILDEFSGKGKIDLTVLTVTSAQYLITKGDASFSPSAMANFKGSVVYTYTAVPEPSSVVLGALGALGSLAFGVCRRSRGARA